LVARSNLNLFVIRERLIRQRATLLLPCVISRAAR
jgi:hypothetical protein